MRAALRKLHQGVGLALILPLLSQSVTGVFLVVLPAFDAVTRPTADAASPLKHRPAEIIATAAAAAPPGSVPSRYRIGAASNAAAVIDFGRPPQGAPEARILIDPGSLAILEVQPEPDTAYRFAHRLHETLLIQGPLGRRLIGWFGLALLFMAAAGIVLWWPASHRWRAAFRVSAGAKGYRFQRELHGAAGIWLSALLILQVLGGISMTFPEIARMLVGQRPSPTRNAAQPADFDLDLAVIRAKSAIPDAVLREIRLPTGPGRPASIALQIKGSAEDAPMVLIRLDAGSQIIGIEDPRQDGFSSAVLPWLRALHAGHGLGPAWTSLIGLFGLALPVPALTGLLMALMRRRNRRSMRH